MSSTKQVVRVGQTYRLVILGLFELLDGHMRSSTFVHTAEDQTVGAFPDRTEHLVSLQESLSTALDLSPFLIVELTVQLMLERLTSMKSAWPQSIQPPFQ